MFYMLSQDGSRLQNMDGYALKAYEEEKRERNEKHYYVVANNAMFVSMPLGEYDTMEDCVAVVKMVAFGLEQKGANENYVAQLPKRDEIKEAIEQFEKLQEYLKTAGQVAGGEIMDMLNELFGK